MEYIIYVFCILNTKSVDLKHRKDLFDEYEQIVPEFLKMLLEWVTKIPTLGVNLSMERDFTFFEIHYTLR